MLHAFIIGFSVMLLGIGTVYTCVCFPRWVRERTVAPGVLLYLLFVIVQFGVLLAVQTDHLKQAKLRQELQRTK